jgi:hypothetical protein
MTKALQAFAKATAEKPVHAVFTAMAQRIVELHQPALAVLAYGSALRDSTPEHTLIDFYVLTQDATAISSSAVSRFLCRLFPPNVHFAEHSINGQSCRAKYAVLPMEQLAAKLNGDIANPYFWVRFAQPMRLVWAKDHVARERIFQLLARAMTTAQSNACRLAPQSNPRDQWQCLFENTYATELRPEDESRAALIVDLQHEHFETIAKLAPPVSVSVRSWSTRRWQGKLLSAARLLKAAFTFRGGADYAAWKIERHSGVKIEVTDWQRRHPILASLQLLPKLLKMKALK